MPLYEYQCTECNQPFELFVRAAAQADGACCQHCHSPRVRRLVSGFATVRGASSVGDAFPQSMAGAPRGGGGCACGGGGTGRHLFGAAAARNADRHQDVRERRDLRRLYDCVRRFDQLLSVAGSAVRGIDEDPDGGGSGSKLM